MYVCFFFIYQCELKILFAKGKIQCRYYFSIKREKIEVYRTRWISEGNLLLLCWYHPRSSAFFGMHSDTFGWSEWWMLTLLLLFLYVFWVFRYFFIIIISYNCILNWKFYAKFLSKYQKSQHYFDIIHFNIHQERGPRISTGGIYKVRPRGFTLILHNMYVCTYDPIWTKRSNGVWNKQCTVSLMLFQIMLKNCTSDCDFSGVDLYLFVELSYIYKVHYILNCQKVCIVQRYLYYYRI